MEKIRALTRNVELLLTGKEVKYYIPWHSAINLNLVSGRRRLQALLYIKNINQKKKKCAEAARRKPLWTVTELPLGNDKL